MTSTTFEIPQKKINSDKPPSNDGKVVNKIKSERENRKPKWKLLPVEIWDRIGTHLDGISLFALIFLNKRISQIVYNSETIWFSAYSKIFPQTWQAFNQTDKTPLRALVYTRKLVKYANLIELYYCKSMIVGSNFSINFVCSSGISPADFIVILPCKHTLSTRKVVHATPSNKNTTNIECNSDASSSDDFPDPSHSSDENDEIEANYAVGRATEKEDATQVATKESNSQAHSEENKASGSKDNDRNKHSSNKIKRIFKFLSKISIASPKKSKNGNVSTLLPDTTVASGSNTSSTSAITSPSPDLVIPSANSSSSSMNPLWSSSSSAEQNAASSNRYHYSVIDMDREWFGLVDWLEKSNRTSPYPIVSPMNEFRLMTSTMMAFSGNNYLQYACCTAMAGICSKCQGPSSDTNRIAYQTASAGAALLNCLHLHLNCDYVVEAALEAIKNLTISTTIADQFGFDHFISAISKALHLYFERPMIVSHGCTALLQIIKQRKPFKKKLKKTGFLHLVAKHSERLAQKLDVGEARQQVYMELTQRMPDATSSTHVADIHHVDDGRTESEVIESILKPLSPHKTTIQAICTNSSQFESTRIWAARRKKSKNSTQKLLSDLHSDITIAYRLNSVVATMGSDYSIIGSKFASRFLNSLSDIVATIIDLPHSKESTALVTLLLQSIHLIIAWDVRTISWNRCSKQITQFLLIESSLMLKNSIFHPFLRYMLLIAFSALWHRPKDEPLKKILVAAICESLDKFDSDSDFVNVCVAMIADLTSADAELRTEAQACGVVTTLLRIFIQKPQTTNLAQLLTTYLPDWKPNLFSSSTILSNNNDIQHDPQVLVNREEPEAPQAQEIHTREEITQQDSESSSSW